MSSKTTQVRDFRGLDNVASPERLSPGWLRTAQNVDVTPEGALVRRPGCTLSLAGAFTGAYATSEQATERLYVVESGSLKQVHPDMTVQVMAAGFGPQAVHWAEANNATYFSNGPDKGCILQDGAVQAWDWPIPSSPVLAATAGSMPAGQYGVACTFLLPDGRETGASDVCHITLATPGGLLVSQVPQIPGLQTNLYISPADSTVCQHAVTTALHALTWNASPDALGDELLTHGMEPVPEGATLIAHWQGRMWAAEHVPSTSTSVLWFSEPLAYHLFNPESGFLQVPGEITMLLAHAGGLIVGTRSAVYAWSGTELTVLADYGVPLGHPGARDEETGTCFFWTERGLCRALPFANLTAGRLHVDPGTHASTAIVQHDGLKKLVTTTRPLGAAFNPRKQP